MIDDEEGPVLARRASAKLHEIGQTIDDLSLEELALRIEVLHAEIERLEQARKSKEATRAGAEALFRF